MKAYLLQQGVLRDTKNIIVESDTDAQQLKKMLDTLKGAWKEYQIIRSYNDILRTIHYPETVWIYTTQTALHPPQNTDTTHMSLLVLERHKKYTEKQCIEWLTTHGYETKKMNDEIGTYFRKGDTINISTPHGTLQASFFWEKIEDIYLSWESQESYTLISLL